ncbi:MAG: TlpA family protein disulfide reductase [Actinomycetota bacterium]|nr:TlpA family protein disulfide reductase [Actinomycetota bacterium]
MTAPPTLSRRAWAAVGAATAAVIVVAAVVGFATTAPSRASGPVLGQSAPAWSGTTLDGSALSSASERGHWVILNFFATWCGPCQRETPQLEEFAAGGRARVVGVVFRDSAAAAGDFVRIHHVTWALVGDGAGSVGSRYRVVGLPVSFVIDPQGRLVKRVFGGVTAASLDGIVPPT